MAKFDVISIGTATFDVYLKGYKSLEISQPKGLSLQCFPLGGKLEIESLSYGSGGGATNAAATFAKQGLKTACISEVGRDEFGELIRQELKKEKVEPVFSLNRKIPTAFSAIFINYSGERTIFVFRGAASDLTLKEIPFEKLKTSWVYLAPGGIQFKTFEKIVSYFHNQGVKIALNPSKAQIRLGMVKLKKILNSADVLLLNQEEAAYLTGVKYENEKKIFQSLDKVVPGILVMTEGPKGVKVSDGYHLWRAEIFKDKRVVDRSGAGDAFGSGFVAGLIRKKEECKKGICGLKNIAYAIRLGSANATSVVESLGTKAGVLTKKQFEATKRWKSLKIKTEKI
ncbi:MAG: carbohydrate kinase family protein [Patescibacteria group bacterium]